MLNESENKPHKCPAERENGVWFLLKKMFFLFLMENFADFMELLNLEFGLSMSNYLLRLTCTV